MRWRASTASSYDVSGAGSQNKIFERGDFKPGDTPRIVAGAQLASEKVAVKIDEHVMIFASRCFIEHDPLKDGCDRARYHPQAGFFPDFASHCVFEPLPGFHQPTGQRPLANKRPLAAFYEQNLPLVENQGSDPEEGSSRITPTHLNI